MSKSNKGKKAKNKGVKMQLFLECGTVDMYDMHKYAKEKLTLHHEPPFRYTHHTVFDESYLLTRDNHDYIEWLSKNDPEKYDEEMAKIKEHKRLLLCMKGA